MESSEKVVQVLCSACKQAFNNHRVLKEIVRNYADGPGEPSTEQEFHRFVECMGCSSLKYVVSRQRLDYGYEDGEFDIKVYPDGPLSKAQRHVVMHLDGAELPDAVLKMYTETVGAINAGVRTLAAGGLRATVEAICRDGGANSKTLQGKIDKLIEIPMFAPIAADPIHEGRHLGNAALHDMKTPSNDSLEDALVIVEALINAVYVLPVKADRLKRLRGS